MKKTTALLALGITLLALPTVRAQGTLTPPGSPAPTQKSLQEIWDKLEKLSSDIPTLIQQAIPPVQGMVPVLGGVLPQGSELAGQRVATFYIGRYEVTWDEWQEVRDWAVNNGYSDLAGVGEGSAGDHPVRNINWHEALKWCNAKSEKDGLTPVYVQSNGEVYNSGLSVPFPKISATGYRLPGESEWEWAARGGVSNSGYIYSGSNNIDLVAWYDSNSNSGTNSVGTKISNELGIHDMSGNVWEWCWDLVDVSNSIRTVRGGSWGNTAVNCRVAGRNESLHNALDKFDYTGFRLALNVAIEPPTPAQSPQ
jgi:formylglycine-generating enzyme required for sulfatase activity